MWFSRASLFSSVIAIAAVLAWLTATNHCLLGAMNAAHTAAASACHCSDHCRDSGSQAKGKMLACCQGLLSTAPQLAQGKANITPSVVGTQLAIIDLLVDFEAKQISNAGTVRDTGPPRENCFVRTVLKRSLRENAPPFLV
jgi:hypothetical protein